MTAELFVEPHDAAPLRPLAARLRPTSLDEYVGQSHLVGPKGPLRLAVEQRCLHSLVLWGPPGVGKTTLARLLAGAIQAELHCLSAVTSGVREIREVVQQAQQAQLLGRATVLFVDEVHRFNKSQQDAFLPHVEEGLLTFIGATTENPSFELNNALLSRVQVHVLRLLTETELQTLLRRALRDVRGLGNRQLILTAEAEQGLIQAAAGDARRLLSVLEQVANGVPSATELTLECLQDLLGTTPAGMDNGGDLFYEQISALHKSVRGSDPDAALYWFARMLEGGCDPLYMARRVVRMASEEVGNADPRALTVALNAWDVQTRLGSPEGELALAQAVVYLAVAPKSNAVYLAYKAARTAAQVHGPLAVPKHLRNAPTTLLRQQGDGADYRYAHDEPEAFAAGEDYFPQELAPERYYHPVPRGLETKIRDKLAHLANCNHNSPLQRRK